jgi:deazaflavin-dependent oxidoreductase (nitroreductase family)
MQLMIMVGVLLLGLATVAVVYVAGMRAKSPLLLKPLVGLQRAVINPRQLRTAGTPGAYAAVIRHRGRVSGQAYETPVGAVPVEDGFLIALVYGPRTNWLRNVLAAGTATIVHEGRTYAVDQPEILPMREAAAHFSPGDRRGFHWIGTNEALRVRKAAPEGAGEAVTGTTRPDGASAHVPQAGRPVETRQTA